jgi:integrase/recombinase XerD
MTAPDVPAGTAVAATTPTFHRLDDDNQVAVLEDSRDDADARVRLIASWLLRHNRPTRTAYHRAVMGERSKASSWLAYLAVRGTDLLGATVADVDAWVRANATAGCAPSTVARDLAAVRGLYAQAVRTGATTSNPAADAMRPRVDDDGTTRVVTRREAAALLDAAAAAGPRDLATVGLLLVHGLRVSEVCGLDRADLDGRLLSFTGKGGRRRTIVVADRVATAIDDHLAHRDDDQPTLLAATDGGRMNRHQVTRITARLGRVAGIDRRVTPHQLRATLATELLDAATALRDVQMVLGHADPRTTARYDRRDRVRVLEAAAQVADGIFTA